MSIGGALTGLLILLQTIVDGDIKKTTYQGTIYVGKIIQKSDEMSWKLSLAEESILVQFDMSLYSDSKSSGLEKMQ